MSLPHRFDVGLDLDFGPDWRIGNGTVAEVEGFLGTGKRYESVEGPGGGYAQKRRKLVAGR